MGDSPYDPFECPYFETERLIASQWTEELANPAFLIYGDREVTQFIGDGTPETSVQSMRKKISLLMRRNQRWPEHWGSWPIFLKPSLGCRFAASEWSVRSLCGPCWTHKAMKPMRLK